MIKLPKRLRDLRYQIFYGLLLRGGYERVVLGDQSLGLQWTICPTGLNAQSVVYSGGVGSDISFEHELVRRFGCSIIVLDPSPTGVQTMARPENNIPQLRFLPLALCASVGKLKMAPPVPGEDSWSAQRNSTGTLEVASTDLYTLMRQNGHTHIDLLKIDIEGCEYEVIDDILGKRILVRQICADFDYDRVAGASRGKAIRAMLKLAARGYKLISQEGANHTFVLG